MDENEKNQGVNSLVKVQPQPDWNVLRELCINECSQTSVNWSSIVKSQNSSTKMWEIDIVIEKKT